MTIRLSGAAVTTGIGAILGLIDAGTVGAGMLRIYTGAQPAGPGTTTAETLLAEFDLSDPSFTAGDPGEADLDTSPEVSTTGVADGTAGWFRIVDSDAAAGAAGIIDGSAGTSGTDLILNTTTITTGVTVTITVGTATLPTE